MPDQGIHIELTPRQLAVDGRVAHADETLAKTRVLCVDEVLERRQRAGPPPHQRRKIYADLPDGLNYLVTGQRRGHISWRAGLLKPTGP